MQVGEIMHTDVKTAGADDTFADVAKIMRSNGISSVVVLEGKKLAGIVTERDIVNLVAAGGDPHSVKVVHGMTRRDLTTITPKTDIAEAAEVMASRNIRHLPVVDRGERRRHHLDPRPDAMGRGGARGRPRDAGHRAEPQGAPGRERSAEAAPQGRVARRGAGLPVRRAPERFARIFEPTRTA